MSTNNLPFFERPDLSPYLIHLTKNTIATDEYSALENLRNILSVGEIWGSSGATGFIKGSNEAVCFMDVPFGSLKYILNNENSNPDAPRYEPYGVITPKTYAYKQGCRPVLYLSNAELKSLNIPDAEKWRVVRLEGVDGSHINWVHEREWRCKGNFKLQSKPPAILVKDVASASKFLKEMHTLKTKWQSLPQTVLPLTVLCQGLPYLDES